MALTYSPEVPQFDGYSNKVVRGSITFDSAYPTGGEAVSIASLGLTRLDELTVTNGDDGYVFQWDRSKTAPKLLAYWVDTTTDGAALAEVAADTDLSAAIVRFAARGV